MKTERENSAIWDFELLEHPFGFPFVELSLGMSSMEPHISAWGLDVCLLVQQIILILGSICTEVQICSV